MWATSVDVHTEMVRVVDEHGLDPLPFIQHRAGDRTVILQPCGHEAALPLLLVES